MANKKYLDGGGLEHAWAKIKNWISLWKITSFGSGAYNNTGTITVSNNLNVASNVQISGELQVIIDTPKFTGDYTTGSTYTVTITRRHGMIYILPRSDSDSGGRTGQAVWIKNMSGETIYFVTLFISLDRGTGEGTGISAAYTLKPSLKAIENGASWRWFLPDVESSDKIVDASFVIPCYW